MADDVQTDIAQQERRLIAAFDRIARCLEAVHNGMAAQSAHDRPADEGRAEVLTRENQRLRNANAELRKSLQVLTDAAGEVMLPASDFERALRAEVEALRDERAAEVAELDGILAELKPLIAGADSNARA